MNKERVEVRQVMTDNVIMMDGVKTITEGIAQLLPKQADAIIINKRNDHDEYGLVLLSDIGKQVLAKGRAPCRVNLYEIMAKPIVSVSPDMDIRYCTRLLENLGLSMAPVIEGDKVVGIVSYRELVLKGLAPELE